MSTDRPSSAEVAFTPVLTRADEQLLDAALCAPYSHVSTDGPAWLTAARREALVRDEERSHLLVLRVGAVVGAVSWARGGTPGFLRLSLTSCRDEAWTPELVGAALARAMDHLLRGIEVRRVELVVGTYNEVVLEHLVSGGRFVAEGVLRERFFLDGRYWPGVVCRADLEAFRPPRPAASEHRTHLMALLRKKTLDDLAAAWEAAAGDGGTVSGAVPPSAATGGGTTRSSNGLEG